MRSPVPKDIRQQLTDDPFMKECIFFTLTSDVPCDGRIEWQHAMTYGGKRVNELYTILPLCHNHHVRQAKFRQEQEKFIRSRIRHFHAEKEFAQKYPKSKLLTS